MPDPISPKYVDVQDEAPDNSVLLESTREGVAFVVINRPHRKNAFDERTVAALAEAFDSLRGAEGVRIVFVRGAEGTFCAGADINWMRKAADWPEEENREDALDLARMLKTLYDLPQLTVALVEGAAFGGGAGLVAACDLAVATKDAKFAFSEVRLGITPAVVSPYVIEAVGPRNARVLFASGRTFGADEARKFGLLQEVVPDQAALNAVQDQLAQSILACAPRAIDEAKQLVRDFAHKPIERPILEESARRIAARRVSAEGREGLSAFLEKRKPNWAL